MIRKVLLLLIAVLILSAVGAIGDDISVSNFDSGDDGWIQLGWAADGSANTGTISWVADIGNPGGAMRAIGYGLTDNDNRCYREGVQIFKPISTAGFHNIHVSYDVRAVSLGIEHTTASGSCAVDHGLIEDQLTVFYSVNGGATWIQLDWLKRSDLLASGGSYISRSIDLSPISCVNNNGAFLLGFRWQFNTDSDTADLDNIIVTGTPGPGGVDTTPPGPTSNITVTESIASGQLTNTLTWTNPADADFTGTMIRFSTTDYPTSPTDGTLVVDLAGSPGAVETFTHTGLTPGTTYYYAAFAHDCVPNYSTTAGVGMSPPPPVENFTATPGDSQVTLDWTAPSAPSYMGVVIVRNTTDYPKDPSDGDVISVQPGSPGMADSFMDYGLNNGQVYYYSAFSFDAQLSYGSMSAKACAIPSANPQLVISQSTFDTGADDWMISTWQAGPYSPGTMEWVDAIGNPGGAMRCTGSGGSDNDDTCTREGGEISKAISTVGYQDIQVSYEIKVNSLGMTRYGFAGSCNVDHGSIHEQLTVFYSVDGGANWVEAGWLERSELLANYQNYTVRRLALPAAANSNPNLMLRFRWQFNAGDDIGDMDNIIVTGSEIIDTTKPEPVSDLTATPSDSQVELSWTTPSDSDFNGTMVRVSTTGYPETPTDGTLVVDKLGSPASPDSFTHTGLTNEITYYYSVWAYDTARNYSEVSTVSAVPPNTNPPAPVKLLMVVDGDGQVTLSWVNPADSDYAGAMIRVSTTEFPATPEEGTLVTVKTGTPGSRDTFVHTGLTNGTTYYYSVFACDTKPNYAEPAQAVCTLVQRTLLENGVFDADAGGWTLLGWAAGTGSPGVIEWMADAGNPGGGIRCCGVGATENNDWCNREGGEMIKIIPTVGYKNIKVAYDFKVSPLGPAYTEYIGGCPVDHGLGEEQLTVMYSIDGGTNWTELEWFRRSDLLDIFQSFGTRSIDLTGVPGVEDNPGFALRFRWQFNCPDPEWLGELVNDLGYIDNVFVSGAEKTVITTVDQAKKALDGEQVNLTDALVTAAFYDVDAVSGVIRTCFAVEDMDRFTGIRVISSSQVSVGDKVDIAGQTAMADGERVIVASTVNVKSSGNPTPKPMYLSNKAVGGGAYGRQIAVVDDASQNKMSVGLNNVGILTRIYGKVTFVQNGSAASAGYFYVDDGSGLQDGSGHTGVRCRQIVTSGGLETLPQVNDYVAVTGVVGVRGNARYFWTMDWQKQTAP